MSQHYRRAAVVAKWMDFVNARGHCVDVFDRFLVTGSNIGSSNGGHGGRITVTLKIDEVLVRGLLQVFSTHIMIVDDSDNILQAIDLDHVHSFKRYQEVLFPNRTFAEMPRFRSTVEMFITGASMHSLVIDGPMAVRTGSFLEFLWRFHYGKLNARQEAMCRGYHLGDALCALSLLPLDIDCFLAQQIQSSSVVNVDKQLVLRIDEGFNVCLIFRPETLAETSTTRAIEIPLDHINLITAREDDLRLVCDDGRVFLINSVVDHANAMDFIFTIFFANAATMVYRKLQFNYPFFTFRHCEVERLYRHYLHVDSNCDGHITQDEFNVSLGPILAQVRSVPKALYALCDCFALGKIRLFEYLHGFRVLLKGNYQDRVRYLFLLFDSKRQGSITYLQFLEGLKTLSQSIELTIQKGETLETLTFRLFHEIDVNRDNSIQFEEFEQALKSNFGVIEAIKGMQEGKRTREELAMNVVVNPAKVISFGHPQWIQICQILLGIELGSTNPAAFKDAPDSTAASQTKFTYRIPNGDPGSGSGGNDGGTVTSQQRSAALLRNPFSKSESVTFSDYCPSIFDAIRKRFGITKEEYLCSLGFAQTKRNLFFGCLSALYEMSSSGRSGSFFYSSTDNRFILKTIPHAESQTLRHILPSYFQHICTNPNTLLTRFCGLHALVRNGQKMIFVVMQNIFQNAVPIQETFDLKGSTINRSTPQELRHLGVALKDNDFDNRKLCVSRSIRDQLLGQLEADSKLLAKYNLNDYSFLLGVHKSLDGPLPADDPTKTPSPRYSAFQKQYGGIPSASQEEVYFVGIIDCLTDYGLKKMGEHISKSVLYDSKQVSCVPPQEYQGRFVEYLSTVFVAAGS